MRNLKVTLSEKVQQQIREQVLFIARHSINNALAWEGRLRKAMIEIGNTPEGHPVDREATRRVGQNVRKMVFERTYLVHYHVNESALVIDILNFRHGGRLPDADEP